MLFHTVPKRPRLFHFESKRFVLFRISGAGKGQGQECFTFWRNFQKVPCFLTGGIAKKQSDVFKQAKARIVLSHIPFTTGDWHGALHLRKLLLPVLNRSNIDLMLSGHEHVYSFHPVNDELRFPTIVNDNETLVKCNINQNGIQVEVIDLKGNVVYEYEFCVKFVYSFPFLVTWMLG